MLRIDQIFAKCLQNVSILSNEYEMFWFLRRISSIFNNIEIIISVARWPSFYERSIQNQRNKQKGDCHLIQIAALFDRN